MKIKNKKILILGASGFLGSHIVRSFIKSGFDVYAGIRKDSNTWRLDDIKSDLQLVTIDLMSDSLVSTVISKVKPSIVINASAYGVNYTEKDVDLSVEVNVNGSYRLFKHSANNKVDRFVQIGSCFEYGNKLESAREIDFLEPTSIYGSTKAAATNIILQCAKNSKTLVTVLRPFGLWGAMESDYRLAPQILNASINNKKLPLTGCTQIRDYTYVGDMASMISLISISGKFPSSKIVNLGSGVPVVLKDFVLAIAKELNVKKLMKFGELPFRSDEMFRLVPDISRLISLNLNINVTPISIGVNQMLEKSRG